MANNRLFNFLRQRHSASEDTNLNIQLISDKEKNYFLIHLPNQEQVIKTSDQVFTLKEHHITIHQTMNNSTSVLSEYHYTGILEMPRAEEPGVEGAQTPAKLKFHVYFDTSDRTWEPQFSIESLNTETGWINSPMPELNQQVKELARTHTTPFIQQAKKELNERVKQLRAEYAQKDKLASDLSAQSLVSEEYKKALAAMEETLELLLPLDKQQRLSELRLIARMKAAVEEGLKVKLTTETETVPVLVETPSEEDVPVIAAPVKQRRTRVKNKCSREERRFNQKIEEFKIQAEFLISLEEDQDLDAQDLLKLYNSVEAPIARFEETVEGQERRPKLKNISIAKLVQLKTIEQSLRNCGEALLLRLVLEKQFDEAKILTPFHLSFDKEILFNSPAYKRDSKILQFLMTYCGLALNQPVTVAGQSYDSLFQYLIPADYESLDPSEVIEPLLGAVDQILNSDVSEWGKKTAEFREATQTAPVELRECFNLGTDIGHRIALSQLPPGLIEEFAVSKLSDFSGDQEAYEAAQKLVATAKKLGMLKVTDASDSDRNQQSRQQAGYGQGTNPYSQFTPSTLTRASNPKSSENTEDPCLVM